MTTRRQQIADVVKSARLARGMTQAQLARAIGAHAQSIGNLERAIVDTSPELIRALETELRINLSAPALAAWASADVIRDHLIARFLTLDESERLMLAGEVLRYITDWTPARDAGGQAEPARAGNGHNGNGQPIGQLVAWSGE